MDENEPYVFMAGACYGCGNPFSFNPNLVPSIRVNADGKADPLGTRQPFCKECIAAENERRVACNAPLPQLTYHPLAYEIAPASSINWNAHD